MAQDFSTISVDNSGGQKRHLWPPRLNTCLRKSLTQTYNGTDYQLSETRMDFKMTKLLIGITFLAVISAPMAYAETLGQCKDRIWSNYDSCIADRDANNRSGDYCEVNRDNGLAWCDNNR